MTNGFNEYSTDVQVKLRRYFIRMGLPIPDLADMRYTTDRGRLCFLTDYGCTIRTKRENRLIRKAHPHFLRPLFARQINNVRMEIFPGIDTPAPGLDVPGFRNYLNDRHDIFVNGRDSHKSNFGYLPGTQFPVMLDIDRKFVSAYFDEAAVDLTKAVDELREFLPNQDMGIDIEQGDPQDQVFGEIELLFENAWPEDQELPDPSLMKRAWEACKDAKKSSQLMAPWAEFDDHRELREKSERYRERIAIFPPSERLTVI